jgi:hypothetical protein
VLSWIRVDGFGGDEGCLPKRDARRVEMESATSGVLLPASLALPLSIFWVCEGSIPNPPNTPLILKIKNIFRAMENLK